MDTFYDKETEEQVLQIHDAFWKALGDRDIEKRFFNCADSITFIGSGLNEKAANKEGLEQYPEKFDIKPLWKRVSLFGDLALVETEFDWEMLFDGTYSKEMLRNTVVLKKIASQWLIIHVHGSMPDYRLTGNNFLTQVDAKRNIELEQQVFQRTKALNEAMENLKATQSQLIQSEKMASLGELTAGIAHEIQNPLNFVNNFSEVSNELIDEMKAELATGNQQLATKIADDIKQNLEKINHHGKRADAIVKGMLQHSRTSSGQKELTDINTLCDEYLRLAYHGLRAKDKSFNAELKTDFDLSLPKINMIPQDVGRVILNLITNAFYAVNERQKAERLKQNAESYEPTVTVSTSHSPLPWRGAGGEVIIKVAHNGNGIPLKIIDKIFQPFFTTKPAGQGTGLGLSLSYDIIKAHGGEIKVETKESEGTTFIIRLFLS